jgi:hypothetical protein
MNRSPAGLAFGLNVPEQTPSLNIFFSKGGLSPFGALKDILHIAHKSAQLKLGLRASLWSGTGLATPFLGPPPQLRVRHRHGVSGRAVGGRAALLVTSFIRFAAPGFRLRVRVHKFAHGGCRRRHRGTKRRSGRGIIHR